MERIPVTGWEFDWLYPFNGIIRLIDILSTYRLRSPSVTVEKDMENQQETDE